MAKVTPNGRALQMIFPAALCEVANIRAGDEYALSSFGDIIKMKPIAGHIISLSLCARRIINGERDEIMPA